MGSWFIRIMEWLDFLVGAIFLVLLGLGMAYEWRKGDLEWARPKPVPPVIDKTKKIKQEAFTEEVV